MSPEFEMGSEGAVQLFYGPKNVSVKASSAACAKITLGSTNLPRQVKTETDFSVFPPRITLRCRDARITAYATICGPQDIIGDLINDVKDCAMAGAVAAGLAAIIAGPAAALPAFQAAFEPCLVQKIGSRINEISVSLGTSHETGNWGPC